MRKPIQLSKEPLMVWVYPVDIRTTFNIAPRLEVTKEMRKLGWKVDLIAVGSDGRCLVEDVEVICLSRPEIYFVRHIFFHKRVISYILSRWREIDVVLFTQISALWLLPLRMLRMLTGDGPLMVMDTRTVPMESIDKSTFKEKVLARFYFFMNALANFSADGQTAITQRMADLLQIPTNKLWGTWASGVNLDIFSSARFYRHWPNEGEPIYIVYIGMLSRARNLTTFCEALMEANRHGMNFHLLVYGEGPEKTALEAIAQKSQGTIAVCATVPHSQIPFILASAHIGVLPFPNEEKFKVSSPIKLFEYIGSGLPILATRIACHTDVVGKDEYLFWAETADQAGMLKALEEIWQKRSDLPNMSQKAWHAAQNWTYAASAKKLNEALLHGFAACSGHVGKSPRHSNSPRLDGSKGI
ncbi:MAG: glycosyltransferase family 4 protein [Chloroflexota bacterium]